MDHKKDPKGTVLGTKEMGKPEGEVECVNKSKTQHRIAATLRATRHKHVYLTTAS
jgi:hypothetical protein